MCFQMTYARAGVLAGQSEELIGGYVVWNDPEGIQASWTGSDPESEVEKYFVAVGTSQGTMIVQFHP